MLFLGAPHLVLTEHFWDAGMSAGTTRHVVIDAITGEATRRTMSVQAYTDDEFRKLLAECGFGNVTFLPSLTGEPVEDDYGLLAIVATRQ